MPTFSVVMHYDWPVWDGKRLIDDPLALGSSFSSVEISKSIDYKTATEEEKGWWFNREI